MKKPKPPADLSSEAKLLWQKLYDEVEFDAAALLLLDTMCQQWDRMMEARREIEKDGAVVEGRFGKKQNPWVQIERDSAAAVMRAWRLLGFDQVPAGTIGRPPGT